MSVHAIGFLLLALYLIVTGLVAVSAFVLPPVGSVILGLIALAAGLIIGYHAFCCCDSTHCHKP